ncbi:hybrid sensor histidine kinase/response regulator [Halorussus halophilus]|uniref:hybrid sensor histidine kinase/response regulator n=1 Tax=Halorussus halophilus TaxID=2650975 RepID=UPI00130138F5|nr:hybrid sensor histidine kinase/response regulator [Halorussus halophilus]
MSDIDPTPDRSLATDICVLHVDDDEKLLEATKTALERTDHIDCVETTTTASEALTLLDEREIHCVVSDQNLSEHDGIELLEAVRRDYPNLPFILFTGTGNEDVASQAISAGVSNYLQKGSSTDIIDVLSKQVHEAVFQRRVEEEMHRGFEAIETAKEGIAMLDEEGEFNYVNEAFAEIFGYEQRSLVGKRWETLNPEGILGRLTEEILPELERTGEWSGETIGKRDDGSTFVADVTVSETKVSGLVCVVSDITERKERQEELRRQNERLDAFAGTVSHDLRNPLNIASVYLNMARDSGEDEHFDELENALNRIENITSDLLELARTGEENIDPEPVRITHLVETVWRGTETNGAELVVEFDDDTELVADEDRLTELIANLFRNAIQHAGSSVRVGTGPKEDGFYIEDDGPGIPEEERERVFESGYTTADSTGFGLSIVQSVAEAHGWDVEITESDAGGACFEFEGVEYV